MLTPLLVTWMDLARERQSNQTLISVTKMPVTEFGIPLLNVFISSDIMSIPIVILPLLLRCSALYMYGEAVCDEG